jgi:hypothetical protein
MTRTVVKANYVYAGGGRRSTATSKMGASGRYYANRPNEHGERQERDAFSAERDGLGKSEWRAELEASEGKYAYRMVMSPGEDLRGDDLKRWTRETLQSLENQGSRVKWLAWPHEDQTKHPHVHVIGFTAGKLDVPDFETLRREGDRVVEQVLERRQELSKDPLIECLDQERALERARGLERQRELEQRRELERVREQELKQEQSRGRGLGR